MERTREGRRSTMAASNGLSRRRQRNTSLRDSPEEDGQLELLQETSTVRLRDRGSKRENDRDFLNRSKRRRGDKIVREEGEETTEDSVSDEDDYEIEDPGFSRILPPNATTAIAAAVLTNHHNTNNNNHHHHHHRKSLPPPPPPPPLMPRVARQAPAFKAADEMISFSVPRKARSASVKRSHESWVTGNGGGFVEEQNHRRASTSPASGSGEEQSPSSSNVSVRKKTKSSGPKTRLPKVSKSSTSAQEDIEFEIAEVLYGLKKQSQSSMKEDNSEIALPKLESNDTNGVVHNDSKSLPNSNFPQTSILAQTDRLATDPLLGVASKKQKLEADATPIQNSLIASMAKDESEQPAKMEVSLPELGKTPGSKVELCEVLHNLAASKAASGSVVLEGDPIMEENSSPAVEESGVVATKQKSVSLEEESAKCIKLDVDFQDSTVTKANLIVSEVETQREERFKIDLMAPPPMASSPEREGFIDLSSDPKPTAQEVEMVRKIENVVKNEESVETMLKKEAVVVELEEKRIKTIGEKNELKLNLEKPNLDSVNDNDTKLLQAQQPKVAISKVETSAQSGSVPLPIAVAGWPSGLPPLGYMPPFQTVLPMDGTQRSSTALQHPHFPLSQPRPKRCATHHYIACNIRLHQQFLKMNHFWPAAAGSAALCRAKPNSLNVMPSAENMIVGNPLQGSFPVVNLNAAQDKGQAVANFPVFTGKDRSYEGVNFMDTAQKKQPVLQQSPQPAPAGNLLHGPAFIFSLNQHQAPVPATSSQTGSSKSAASINNASLSGNGITGVATNSSVVPAVAAAVSFNYPNLAANEAPYLTILPNSGYPFPISTPVGNPPAFRGGNPAQALSFYHGSFYPPQLLHPSQSPQQQPYSQSLVLSVHQNASTSSCSSSSHKQPQNQLPRGAQVSGNNFLTSMSVLPQQPQKQHVPSHQSRKLETEISGESTSTIADARASHSQKSVHGQNFTVSLQPNFAVMPTATPVGGGSSGNHGEKQQRQHSQEKSLKGGVELVPPQAFAMSFASFNGNNTASNLNFSSVAQNPVILQSFPDMTRQGYQVVSAPQSAPKKIHRLTEGKTEGCSVNPDDGKKATLGKSLTSVGQTLVFDNSATNLSFVSSPFTGSWPSHPVTSTTNAPIAANSSSSPQQQRIQLQKQHMHQQQQLATGAARSKGPTANSLPSSSIGAKFSNNAPIFSQNLAQSSSSLQNSQWKNSSRTPVSQPPLTSLVPSNTSTLKNVSQQQGRAPQIHSQISFGGNLKSTLAPQGQQVPPGSQSLSPLVAGPPPSGANLRPTLTSAKASGPALQSQQSDNSSTGNAQKSSPVCGRNVPSILSTCPSHLSELKY